MISCQNSRYRAQYWQYRARYRVHIVYIPLVAIPDIGPISCFFPISGPISCTYRVHTVSRHRRYRVFHRYRARYGPDIANNITIYGNHVQKNTTSSPMCLQYHNIRISGTFRCRGVYMMSGTICHLLPVRLRPPPPALARRSDWSSLRICPGAPT